MISNKTKRPTKRIKTKDPRPKENNCNNVYACIADCSNL
jgi:hypothetical protein